MPRAMTGFPASISLRIKAMKSSFFVSDVRRRSFRFRSMALIPQRNTFAGSSKVRIASTLPPFQQAVSQVSRKAAPLSAMARV